MDGMEAPHTPTESGWNSPPMSPTGAGSPSRRRRTIFSTPQQLQGGEECVQVCVRVRPFSRRELDIHSKLVNNSEFIRSVVDMPEGNSGGRVKVLERTGPGEYVEREEFNFTRSFWSIPEEQQPHRCVPATQEDVYQATGKTALDHALTGFNTCIFAYGQTGSGKTHTMMGEYTLHDGQWEGDPGLVPRFCKDLFERIAERINDSAGELSVVQVEYDVKLSAIEIYNEAVRDLFWKYTPGRTKNTHLKVRVHPMDGAFVDQVTVLNPTSWEECTKLVAVGVAERAVASTLMNDESSRSHCLFTISITQKETFHVPRENPDFRYEKPSVTTKQSRVNLVDLAGSERNKKSGAQGQQLKEAAGINQSLSTLKKVIVALVQNSREKAKQLVLVPYRESTLTHLLSHSLGGNSKTTMIACVSPHYDNYEETVMTLRYAYRAKGIVNHAKVNTDDVQGQAQALRAQILQLQEQLASGATADPEEVEALRDQIDVGQQALQDMQVAAAQAEAKAAAMEEELTKEKDARYNAAFYNSFRMIYLDKSRKELEKRVLRAEAEAKVFAEREGGYLREIEDMRRRTLQYQTELEDLRTKTYSTQAQHAQLSEYATHLESSVEEKEKRILSEKEMRMAAQLLVQHRHRKERTEHELEMAKLKKEHDEYIRNVLAESTRRHDALTRSCAEKESDWQKRVRAAEQRSEVMEVTIGELREELRRSHVQQQHLCESYEQKLKSKDVEVSALLERIRVDNESKRSAMEERVEYWKHKVLEEHNSHVQALAALQMECNETVRKAQIDNRSLIQMKDVEWEERLAQQRAADAEVHATEVHRVECEAKVEMQNQERKDQARLHVIESLRARLKDVEQRERHYGSLANTIDHIMGEVPAKGGSEDYLRLLEILKTFVAKYRSNAPTLYAIWSTIRDTGEYHAVPAPTTLPASTGFFPLQYPEGAVPPQTSTAAAVDNSATSLPSTDELEGGTSNGSPRGMSPSGRSDGTILDSVPLARNHPLFTRHREMRRRTANAV